MRLIPALVLTASLLQVTPSLAKSPKKPVGNAFMEIYSNMYLVPVERDFIGYQVSILHVINDSGQELRVLWQQGQGGLTAPQLLTPELRGDALVIHVQDDGDWTLRISDTQIEAVSPRGRHERLRRIKALN